MTEMVTRVAKAMAESAGFCWENCAQSQWERDAKAGIEAMRVATQGILDCRPPFMTVTDARAMWETMIDSASGRMK